MLIVAPSHTYKYVGDGFHTVVSAKHRGEGRHIYRHYTILGVNVGTVRI